MTEPNLRFPAVCCENLRSSANICGFSTVSCALQMLEFPGEGVNLRKAAVFCESLRFGLSRSPQFRPLKRAQIFPFFFSELLLGRHFYFERKFPFFTVERSLPNTHPSEGCLFSIKKRSSVVVPERGGFGEENCRGEGWGGQGLIPPISL